jgi:N-acetylmuramoyl-L-alanine amidase
LASRANHFNSFGCALLCAAAWACLFGSPSAGAAAEAAAVAVPSSVPVASDARLAGDVVHTRFILDLDQTVTFRAFTLADPYRVVIDLPEVNFRVPPGTGAQGRGLVKAFRYGLVLPGGSRIVFDLSGPARIVNSYVLNPANGQPPRLVVELEEIDRGSFLQSVGSDVQPELKPAIAATAPIVPSASVPVVIPSAQVAAPMPSAPQPAPVVAAIPRPMPGPVPAQPQAQPQASTPAADKRPLVVIDPGHGGEDNGTQMGSETEKTLVLGFALALRQSLEKSGKCRVIMTRDDDTFVPLGDRVRIARNQSAALFVSIHADALPRTEGDAQGATIYTLSDKASDAEAQRLADAENRADAIGGVKLAEEPTDVADILIDLVQRETRTFSNRFAHLLMSEIKTSMRMHKHPLKSAGFKVLKAPDVPSVLVELGYVSNKDDLEHLLSDSWRSKAVAAMSKAIDSFLSKRLATAAPAR